MNAWPIHPSDPIGGPAPGRFSAQGRPDGGPRRREDGRPPGRFLGKGAPR